VVVARRRFASLVSAGANGVALQPDAPASGTQAPTGSPPAQLPTPAAADVAALERKVVQQALDLDFFRAALQHLAARRRPTDRRLWRDGIYAVIQAQTLRQGTIGIERMYCLADVSRAGDYRHWRASAPAREEVALRDEVQRLSLSQRFYGYLRITALLRHAGWAVNHKRVQQLRQTDNLLCVTGRTFRSATTESRHSFTVYPNLARRMVPAVANQLWIADITYMRLGEAFVYLVVVLDAWSRRVVGWAMADHLRGSLSLAVLEMALTARPVMAGGRVHHSDRGVQYACGDYIERLAAAGVQPSMSRVGCPWDNAMAESFMRTLKREEIDGKSYRDQADAQARIEAFIEEVYNRQRLHSALDHRSPMLFENENRPPPPPPHAAAVEAVTEITCVS
jgi:transposase InsO family protein